MNQTNKLAPVAAVGTAAVLAMGSASAAAIDVTGVVSEIALATGPIGLIGSAVLLVIVAIATFKWVRRAF